MTKVVLIGAGKGGRALLEMFSGDPTVSILGIADANPWAPGLELARRLDIPVATDLRAFVADLRPDLIIDVTGNPDVRREMSRLKPPPRRGDGGSQRQVHVGPSRRARALRRARRPLRPHAPRDTTRDRAAGTKIRTR